MRLTTSTKSANSDRRSAGTAMANTVATIVLRVVAFARRSTATLSWSASSKTVAARTSGAIQSRFLLQGSPHRLAAVALPLGLLPIEADRTDRGVPSFPDPLAEARSTRMIWTSASHRQARDAEAAPWRALGRSDVEHIAWMIYHPCHRRVRGPVCQLQAVRQGMRPCSRISLPRRCLWLPRPHAIAAAIMPQQPQSCQHGGR